jgi:hypothetical protein
LNGPFPNRAADFANNFVSGTVGAQTGAILNASILPGSVGVYQVDILLSSGLTNNPITQGTVAQELNLSNVVTIPVHLPQ